jgi:hypothetical protein
MSERDAKREFHPVIEPTTLKYAPRDKAPVCFFAADQGLITTLHTESRALFRAAMTLIMTPHICDYLTQHAPQELLQLRAACGLTEAVVGATTKHGPDCACGRCR